MARNLLLSPPPAFRYNPRVPPRNLKQRLLRTFLFTVLALFAAAALVFATDFAIFRIRVFTNRNAYGSVNVNHYYAVLMKNGKTQFIFDPPGPQTCVNSLFPHASLQPCWYLRRHPDQRTDL